MNEDQKLTVLAAKAVGIEHPGGNHSTHDDGRLWDCKRLQWWNPLHDDGDALRLASRLCMTISTGPCEAGANTIPGVLRGFFPKEETIVQGQDAAVRRVIVRSAADDGKAMP